MARRSSNANRNRGRSSESRKRDEQTRGESGRDSSKTGPSQHREDEEDRERRAFWARMRVRDDER